MISLTCLRCGATMPLSLAHDTFDCPACHERGPLPAATLQHVLAARQVLAEVGLSKRQLGAAQQRALRWSGLFQGCFVTLLALFALGFLGMTALLVYLFLQGDGGTEPKLLAWLIVPSFLPLVLFLVPGLAYLLALRRRRRTLETSCAADAPTRPGEPARCHVCGGELAAVGATAVARCGYCQADNLVAPSVLARAARTRVTDLSLLAQRVAKEAGGAGSASIAGMALLPVLSVAAPVLSAILWAVAVVSAAQIEGPVDRDVRLIWVESKQGRCIAQYRPELPPGHRLANTGLESMVEPSAPETFDGSVLVGQRVRTTDSFSHEVHDGSIVRAYTSPLLPGTVYVLVDSGGELKGRDVLANVCAPAPAR